MTPTYRKIINQVNEVRRWTLTPLGVALLAVLFVLIAAASAATIRSLADQRKWRSSPQSIVETKPTDLTVVRTFSTSDAVDFAQRTYVAYIDETSQISEIAAAEGQPYQNDYDLTFTLRRLEAIRSRLSPSLHKKLQFRYKEAATVATITRDEVFCGPLKVTGVSTALSLGSSDLAIVVVEQSFRGVPIGKIEVTVDLNNRVLTDIACR